MLRPWGLEGYGPSRNAMKAFSHHKILLSCVTAFGLGLALSACDDAGKDVCEQAADIITDDCGIEGEGGGGDGESAACEGAAEAAAQCIVDYPEETCAFFEDPVANADNAYAQCAAG